MARPTRVLLHKGALRHNFQKLRVLAGNRSIMAMVKANAYGHGIVQVATNLPDADAFGVACLEEAVMLRKMGVSQPIVLMEGVFDELELKEIIRLNLRLVVHHSAHIDLLTYLPALDAPISVWMKINTGMHRLGFSPETFPAQYERLSTLACVEQPIGLMTHFAQADVLSERRVTLSQIELFNGLTKHLPGARSLANSAGILQFETQLCSGKESWVRPGLLLYGVSPLAKQTGVELGFSPVMSLVSEVIALQAVPAGGRVGYGGDWQAKRNSKIAVVACGYGDGYPQFAPAGTPVWINGMEYPLAGRVSMDILTVDVTDARIPVEIGDEVELWGRSVAVERVAGHCKTSQWELLTRITPRPLLEMV